MNYADCVNLGFSTTTITATCITVLEIQVRAYGQMDEQERTWMTQTEIMVYIYINSILAVIYLTKLQKSD